MHHSFLKFLADPESLEPLTLEATEADGGFVESGFLRSSVTAYPIVRGIPRFVGHAPANYSRSFGYQWHRWPRLQFESENIGKPMEGHTRAMWQRITGVDGGPSSLQGTTVIDIGCGPGRFVDVARSKGAHVIGIDYSDAVEGAERNFKRDPNVCVCQADAMKLPLRRSSIDGAFSIGVLHHTPNPAAGIAQAHAALKDNGWFAVSVYGKGGYYDFPSVQFWRRAFKALWPVCGHIPPLIYAHLTVGLFRPLARRLPPLGTAIKGVFPFINLSDRRWSVLDTFDSVTPSYQSAHESYEVFDWLRTAGFGQVEPTNWGFTSYRGIKIAVAAGSSCTNSKKVAA